MAELEFLIKRHEYAFEGTGAFTHHLYNKYGIIYFQERTEWTFSKEIDKITVTDLARRRSERIGVVGISHGFIDAV
jgi:hypothetical protein